MLRTPNRLHCTVNTGSNGTLDIRAVSGKMQLWTGARRSKRRGELVVVTGDQKRYRIALVDQDGTEVELTHRNWDRETKKAALGVYDWLAGLNMEPYVAGVGLYDRDNPKPVAYHAYHRTHYHVVTFVNGCLNDCEEGPYESQRDAFSAWGDLLESWMDAGHHVVVTDNSAMSGHRAVVDGTYVITVESCEAYSCYEQ